MSLLFYLLLLSILTLLTSSLSANNTVSCPLNITVLTVVGGGNRPAFNSDTQCHYILQAIHLLQADYLRRTGLFVPPLNSSTSCWNTFQSFINKYDPTFDVRSSCGLQTSWISQGCMGITTLQQFEDIVPSTALQSLQRGCNQSFQNNAPCAICTTQLSTVLSSLTGPTIGNVSDCRSYTTIYAASLSDPTNPKTVQCLFGFDFSSSGSNGKHRKTVKVVASVISVLGLLILFCGFWAYWRLKQRRIMREKGGVGGIEMRLGSGLDSMNESTTLIRFTFEEINKGCCWMVAKLH